jgi:hypothetical protein
MNVPDHAPDPRRRWHHVRPEPRRRSDLFGINSSLWTALAAVAFVGLFLTPSRR